VPIRPRVIYALPTSLVQLDGAAGYHFAAILRPDGAHDPHYRWRDTAPITEQWNITASGQTAVINNTGQDETYPILTLTPTSANASGGYTYKRWIPIKWRNAVGSALYPIELTNGGLNTAALVTAGKMRSDGGDIRVEVNGAQVNRWIGGMNGASTKIWVGLPFQYIAPVTLASALGAGAVTSVEVNGDITAWPASGIFMVGNEAFSYTSKVDNKRQFLGITRGAHGTTAASHSAGAQADLIQHSVYLFYGNPTAVYAAPSPTPAPVFDLATSTNGVWNYTQFGENAVARMGAWSHLVALPDYAYAYSTGGAAPKALVSPWDYLGIGYTQAANIVSAADVIFENICGIDGVNITAGEIYASSLIEAWGWSLTHYGSVNGVSQVAATTALPVTRNAVTSWTQNVSLTGLVGTPTRYHFGLQVRVSPAASLVTFAGINSATVTLKSANLPTVSLGAETSNYRVAATLTNVTTGQALTIDFNMSLNVGLRINTEENSVVYLADNSSQGQAVRRIGAARRFWLPLQPGNNTLRYDDAGTGNVTLSLAYLRRYYT
jgi:hypothetical protein